MCPVPTKRLNPTLSRLPKRKIDNYSGAVYDFAMVIDRAEVPSAADYVRRACAFCCGQVSCSYCCTSYSHTYVRAVSLFSSDWLPSSDEKNASGGDELPSDCCAHASVCPVN